GVIDENSIGAFKGRVLDRIIRDHGTSAGKEFIDNVTKLGIAAITIFGFTTGIDDEDIPVESKKTNRRMKYKMQRKKINNFY
ncbi:RNA polymerase Rpb1, domain 3, partial [Thermoplasmatales archaeon SCGC AB-539-C06]